MKPFSSSRTVACLALFVIARAVAGPGAIVATLAAIAAFDGDHAHHVSIQQDGGHDDFVFCHDAQSEADRAESAFAANDCADDHRLHAANTASLASRHDRAASPHDAIFALVAAPLAETAMAARELRLASSPTTLVARSHQGNVVLRI